MTKAAAADYGAAVGSEALVETRRYARAPLSSTRIMVVDIDRQLPTVQMSEAIELVAPNVA